MPAGVDAAVLRDQIDRLIVIPGVDGLRLPLLALRLTRLCTAAVQVVLALLAALLFLSLFDDQVHNLLSYPFLLGLLLRATGIPQSRRCYQRFLVFECCDPEMALAFLAAREGILRHCIPQRMRLR